MVSTASSAKKPGLGTPRWPLTECEKQNMEIQVQFHLQGGVCARTRACSCGHMQGAIAQLVTTFHCGVFSSPSSRSPLSSGFGSCLLLPYPTQPRASYSLPKLPGTRPLVNTGRVYPQRPCHPRGGHHVAWEWACSGAAGFSARFCPE